MKHKLHFLLFVIFLLLGMACGGRDPEPAVEPESTQAPAAVAEVAPTDVPVTPVEEVAPAEAPEPTAVPTKEPEPTAEPLPTAVPVPAYVAIDVDPGIYLYTGGNYIRDMTLHDGKMWVASLGGVVAWDLESGASQKYTTLDGLPHVGVYGIVACPVPEMTLLAATEDGLAAYDPTTDSWYMAESVFKTEPVSGLFGVSGQNIGVLLCDTANNRLILEYKGVTLVNLADGSTSNVPSNELSWSGVRRLTTIGNQVWVSSGYRGFTILDGDQVRPLSKHAGDFEVDAIYHLAVAPNGDVWMAAASEGLVQYRNGQVVTTFTRDNTANFAAPYYVAFDPGGNMWLGMTNRLCQFDPATSECTSNFTATQTPGMTSGEVSKILFDDAGNLYYHTFEGGWSRFDGANWQLFRENDLPIHAVNKLMDDRQGNIWLLGGTAATYSIDLEMKGEWQGWRDIGGEQAVSDDQGNIWMAYGRNFYHYDGFQIVRRQVADGLLDSYARTLAIAHDGRVWIGQDDGVSIWDGSDFTIYTSADDDWPEGRIQTILVDGEVLWVGSDKGLIRVEDNTWEQVLYSGVVNLPSAHITSLAKMADGRLVLGTTHGLAYYDHAGRKVEAEAEVTPFIQDVFVSIDGELFVASSSDVGGGLYIYDEEGWLHLTTADGLPTNKIRAVLVDSAGTLWIGGGYFGNGGGLMRIVP